MDFKINHILIIEGKLRKILIINETQILIYFTDKSKYRLVCWSLSERGAVGETILHLCLLNATSLHADLAKRLLRFYPNLINDIYLSDEYYGNNTVYTNYNNTYYTITKIYFIIL